MWRHRGLIAVCAYIVVSVGCENRFSGPAPVSPLIPRVHVEFGGRVVNADVGGPVANVRVSLSALSSTSGGLRLASANETGTSGADGTFTLTLDLPSDWRMVGLKFEGPGFDERSARFEPTANPCGLAPCWAAADRPDVRIYPTLVISPGESIDVRVEGAIAMCGSAGDGGPCRRVLVSAPAGDPVELEVVSDDSSNRMALSLVAPPGEPDMSVQRLMVAPGSSPYVLGGGIARLTARR